MTNLSAIKERFLQDDKQRRLGNLAADLARIASFADDPANREAVESLLEESKYFIEWSAPENEIEVNDELVDLQLSLALWHYDWPAINVDKSKRQELSEKAKSWSDKILKLSGII